MPAKRASPRRSPDANEAIESAYPQNPVFIPAFTGVGIKYFGTDASKPYPNPTIAGSIAEAYPAGATFVDGPAQAIPRYPTNIYYNVSTEAQEVDEYNTLYTPEAQGGKCEDSSTTRPVRRAPGPSPNVVEDVDHEHVPAPDGQRPTAALLPPAKHDGHAAGRSAHHRHSAGHLTNTGDGLFYSVMNPLLAVQRNFNTPIEQPTMAQIGATARRTAGVEPGQRQPGQRLHRRQPSLDQELRRHRSQRAAHGRQPGRLRIRRHSVGMDERAGSDQHRTSDATWPAAPAPVQQEPQGSWLGKFGSAGYLLADWDGVQDFSDLPGVTATLEQGSRYEWTAITSGRPCARRSRRNEPQRCRPSTTRKKSSCTSRSTTRTAAACICMRSTGTRPPQRDHDSR